ncbi:SALP-1 [Giardia duodenalis]|uniref:SALP-1 n=2 Tax=Giardia intestinalis TaxID=5741 RepID=E2RUA1_GIAIC|nr:SALP-1 [Giardia intestinalis]AAN73280.1 SALP-1 [Giardia intestinalis]ESU38663.1 Assemblin/beta giardin family protein [Giardia intestinalis]KAE8303575.1 SALP-1 [Giardia intestinalis]|eukprot:XP_001708306.1 SALP-1 [Giardia lamblia ATCC 50803]
MFSVRADPTKSRLNVIDSHTSEFMVEFELSYNDQKHTLESRLQLLHQAVKDLDILIQKQTLQRAEASHAMDKMLDEHITNHVTALNNLIEQHTSETQVQFQAMLERYQHLYDAVNEQVLRRQQDIEEFRKEYGTAMEGLAEKLNAAIDDRELRVDNIRGKFEKDFMRLIESIESSKRAYHSVIASYKDEIKSLVERHKRGLFECRETIVAGFSDLNRAIEEERAEFTENAGMLTRELETVMKYLERNIYTGVGVL